MSYTLRKVGFWWSPDNVNAEYPRVETAIAKNVDRAVRFRVLSHVRNGQEHAAYRGWSDCRICGKMNGSRDLTDGVYVWPEGLAHYIEKHDVMPPVDFVEHVIRTHWRRR